MPATMTPRQLWRKSAAATPAERPIASPRLSRSSPVQLGPSIGRFKSGDTEVKTNLAKLLLALALGAAHLAPAHALPLNVFAQPKLALPTQGQVGDAAQLPVKPSQAALIALEAHPGAVVLGVKLLPTGEYAVTLKMGGSVLKVLVNATSGAMG